MNNGDVYAVMKIVLVLFITTIMSFVVMLLGLSNVSRAGLVFTFFGAFVMILVNIGDISARPKYYSDKKFMELCNWIKAYTDIDAVFLTEPFTDKGERMRLTSGRSIFCTFELIGSGIYNEAFAKMAMERYNFMVDYLKKIGRYKPGKNVKTLFFDGYKPVMPVMRRWYDGKMEKGESKEGIRRLLLTSPETEIFIEKVNNRYKVDYVISETPLLLNFPVVFKNDDYLVYKVT